MTKKKSTFSKSAITGDTAQFEDSAQLIKARKFILKLYVTGPTPQSTRALSNVKAICEAYLKGHYELEVIDIYQHPNLARENQIIAAPTLVKTLPLPVRKLIGDLSQEEKVLIALDIKPLKKTVRKKVPKSKIKKKTSKGAK